MEKKHVDGTEGVDMAAVPPAMDPLEYVKSSPIVQEFQSKGPIIYSAKRPVRNLFSIRGSIMTMVVCSFEFSLLNALHIVLLVLFQTYGIDGRDNNGRVRTKWKRVTSEMFTVLSPLLVFVLVFFNNQAYKRYMEQFFTARKVEGRVKYITHRLRAYFRNSSFPGAQQSMCEMLRTILVAHYALYLNLPLYKKRPIHQWGWEYMQKYQLVSRQEYEGLRNKTGPEILGEARCFCLDRLAEHVRHGHIDTVIYRAFEEDLGWMTYLIMTITAYASNPIPFAYYHLANLLVIGVLVLISYAFVFLDSYLTILVYLLLSTAILGLRGLSCALADPFGVDDTDFKTIVPTAMSHVSNERLISRDSDFGRALLPTVPLPPS